jgi:hypothetical protein
MLTREERVNRFSLWVFWTGLFNILAYIWMTCPRTLETFLNLTNSLNKALRLGGAPLLVSGNVNDVLLINILGMIVVFLGVMLIMAALEIEKRAWFVFLEGLIRIFAFLFILYAILFMNAARILLLFGLADLIIGIIYLYYIFTIEALRMT